MVSPLHSAATMATAVANDPSLVGVAPRPALVADQAVTSWLQSNPGATDATIAAAMQQYGVDPAQMARVTGLGQDVVQSRYEAALPAPAATPAYFQQNPDVAAAFQQNSYGLTPEQFASTHYQKYGATEQRAAPTDVYEQLVRDAYGSIGRTGVGDAASNIDQAGFDYWVNTLQSGASTPEAFNRNFQTAVADYLVTKPEDQYSSYVTDFLTETKPAAVSGIVDLYQDVLGRAPDAGGLGHWFQQFGSEISPEERAAFEQSAQAELDSRIQGLYTDFMGSGRIAEQEGLDYWKERFGSEIDDSEREQFRQAAATELSGAFGEGDAGLLAGFKYAKDLGVSDEGLRATLGDDLYNQYQGQLQNFATTNIDNIIADNSLTFDESQKVANFARDLGFDSQQLADLTGKDKSLFDNILTSYDTNRNKIINDTLTGENVKTDADRVVAAYALERQFGFTDDELSQATGVDVDVIKASLDPVRNFETDFSEIANNTDSTTQQLKDFISSAKSNAAVNQLYGESLAGYENKIGELEQKWSKYGSDPIQSENLFQQLNAQKDALGGQYYRGVFSDLEKSAALLVKKGLDTLSDLGQKDKFQTTQADVKYTVGNGVPVQNIGGQFMVYQESGESGQYVTVSPDEVTTTYGRNEYVPEGDGGGYDRFIPLTAEEQATLGEDGTYQKKIGTVVIDKDTGQELTGTDGNLLYQRSGGHFTGKKHYLTANFTDEGVPYLTASQEKSGIYGFVSDVGPMVISFAAMVPGPHQPFAMAANAALALSQKNYIGAVLSGLGAYGTSVGSELKTISDGVKAGTIANTADTAAKIKDLTTTLSNVRLATTTASGLNALATKNLPGLINAGLSAYGQTGGKLPSGLTTAVQAGNFAVALDRNDTAGALSALGDLTGSKDLKVAATAKNMIDALESGEIGKITQAGMMFANAFEAANPQSPAPVETLKSTSYDANVTDQLADAGLEEEVSLPSGVQLASLDGGSPFRAEVSGRPIFAEDPRAAGIRPPAGYRVLSVSEQQDRLVSEGVGDAPSKYETVRPEGSYLDRTLNAWLAPSGEFEAATNVEDFSKYFEQSNLSDSDVAAIYQGVQTGNVTADDLYWLTGQSGKQLSAEDIRDIVSSIPKSGGGGGIDMGEMVITAPRPPATDMGEMVITGEREPATDMGEMVITAPRDPVTDMGEMVITAPRYPVTDMGEMVITAPRETLPVDILPEEEFPEMVITAPREPAPVAPAPAPTSPAPRLPPPAPVVPPKLVQQVALQLGVPANSQIAIDVAEALYGTMDYLDISEEFKPSERKAKPAATQKQQQQTKMAQGGYLDTMLAEELSVDDLLNLLR
jgi:hypothetical protein